MKPVTFMNNSGESVAALAKFYRVPPQRVLVISDDLDMPVAQVRVWARVKREKPCGVEWRRIVGVHAVHAVPVFCGKVVLQWSVRRTAFAGR